MVQGMSLKNERVSDLLRGQVAVRIEKPPMELHENMRVIMFSHIIRVAELYGTEMERNQRRGERVCPCGVRGTACGFLGSNQSKAQADNIYLGSKMRRLWRASVKKHGSAFPADLTCVLDAPLNQKTWIKCGFTGI